MHKPDEVCCEKIGHPMNLPNYFLADLPREAPFTPRLVSEACQTLKRNRDQYLDHYSTDQLLGIFDELGRSWLNPGFRFRKMALESNQELTGFSPCTLATGLDAFFQQLTGRNLEALITQDLGHPRRLDELVSTEMQGRTIRSSIARGPELIGHIAAGNIPVPVMLQMVLGFLVRSAQFIKCASGAAFLPRLFAHSIYEIAPKLGACLEIADWKGGNDGVEAALFRETDCVISSGTEETISSIRQQLPSGVRYLAYGHRVSFGFITRDALSSFTLSELVTDAASDVAAWNQLGCLSPHLFYVEHGGRITAEQFAEMLASELESREQREPRGRVSTEVAASIASLRAIYELRAAHSAETRCWFSPKSTAWTVIFETDPRFQLSCLNRFVYVKGAANLTEALQAADPIRRHVSTVGVAVPSHRAHQVTSELARWGVSRVCPIGQMQRPPLSWRHDGRPALGDLVRWTDWEH